MADFPGSIFDQRTIENLPGISYDAAKTTHLYAEDVQELGDEVTAIENTLGTNPEGLFATVKARLDSLPGVRCLVGFGITRWVLPGWVYPAVATVTYPLGELTYIPFVLTKTTSFQQLGVQVSTLGAGSVRLGIYSSAAGVPSTLIVDGGSVAVSGIGAKTVNITQTLGAGLYFLAIVSDVAFGTSSGVSGTNAFYPCDLTTSSMNGNPAAVVPRIGGQSALVAGGLPSSPVAPFAYGVIGNACARLRLT